MEDDVDARVLIPGFARSVGTTVATCCSEIKGEVLRLMPRHAFVDLTGTPD